MGGGEQVEEAIPLLFRLTSLKNTKVVNLREMRESGGQWSLQLRRLLQDWEIEVGITRKERFKRKLAACKKQYLSMGGRLTLIKCTLSNLPIYFMSLIVIPKKVRIKLERIQREFLRGDLEERRKIHLVGWSVICKDKKHGGLGLRHLERFNQALLGKWPWRFPLERESFWRKVIVEKFGGVDGGWTIREFKDSYGMGLWKDIRKEWEDFLLRTSIHIGNGRHTRFW